MKYTNFAISLVNCFGAALPNIEWLVLPLGISFYTFQSVGYVIDVYRETAQPQKNFLKYALYVSFFPQICQGPIGRYNDLAPQLYAEHRFDYNEFVMGLERILLGFFKKTVIADRLAEYVNSIYSDPSAYAGPVLVFATVMYAFQLYADFSGYMDIAIGAGRCFGVTLAENFKTPYFSRSVAEYWRRWHITLGAWFRDYLYYPILRSGWCTGIRKRLSKKGHKNAAKLLTTAIGLAITWFLTGLWHGASGNFILYGCYYGAIIILSMVLEPVYDRMKTAFHIKESGKLWKLFQTVRTFALVTFGYVLFRSSSASQAVLISKRLFVLGPNPLKGLGGDGLCAKEWLIYYIGLIFLCLVIELIENKVGFLRWLHKRPKLVRWLLLYVVVAIIILFANWNTSSAGNFLYFNF